MSNTTNITELPIDPMCGGGSGVGGVGNNINVPLHQPDKDASFAKSNNVDVGGNVSLDQFTINQIVSGLQQATTSGITMLKSRDIPTSTEKISIDPQIQVNHIPNHSEPDYISNNVDTSDIINTYNNSQQNRDKLDDLYNEIQMPILLCVLYFLFQLPILRKYLYSYFPVLFATDGNYNINGFLFTSILFALLFYVLNKIMNHFK
jgi:hypothetical protein